MAESLTENELLEELKNYFGVREPREPGWVDYKQVAKFMNINRATAIRRLNKLVEDGEWEFKKVYDPSIRNNIKVYRKIDEQKAES